MYKNHDEAMRAEELQELKDRAEINKSMSVREYATLRGLQPQRVYYYIRQHRIDQRPCGECGRKVIDVEQADAIFVPKEEEELRGSDLDT